jgi:hypothetical protein
MSAPGSRLRGDELGFADALAALFGPASRNGASAPERHAARRLIETAPTASTPTAARAAWWELVASFTTPTRPLRDYGRNERPPGCPSGHDASELAWHSDNRNKNGGEWYCRACRREERRERGWS